MPLHRIAVPAILALLGCALLAQPAAAREQGSARSPHSRHRDRSETSGRQTLRSPWDWHPGMAGDSDWSRSYAPGLVFGFDRGGWSRGWREDGWSVFYDNGNLRLRYSRGGIHTGPAWRESPWLRPGLCAGCGSAMGCCRCDYGAFYSADCWHDGFGPRRVIVFTPGQGDDRSPAWSDPLYVDGQALSRAFGGVYYDNRVIKNYYGDVYSGAAAQAGPRREQAPGAGPSGPDSAVAAAAEPRPYGSLFFDRLRLATPDGEREFLLREGVLSAGPPGHPALVARAVDMAAGAYALVEPERGSSLIYLRDGQLYGACQSAPGQWYEEALPLGRYADGRPLRVSGELSMGLVGREMWVSFSADNGARYLFIWEHHTWREIGSAHRAN